jgi:UTP--glucose-1-phosphate uridylyltransferase
MKVVIPAAGLGTRLLPVTKELPKEMLPIFLKQDNELCLKPMLQAVFEQLYTFGFREFGIIVGKGKRAIEDHFMTDENFLEYLKNDNKAELVDKLLNFYDKINTSSIFFINQSKPRGFGDAVYKAKTFTGNEPFMVHAGDDLILSPKNNHFRRLVSAFEDYKADTIFLVEEVEDPRKYGVIIGEELNKGLIKVNKIIEKPKISSSNLAVVATYIFNPKIYHALETVDSDEKGELQLTDAIQYLLDIESEVYALKLDSSEKRLEIGTIESYWKTLSTSYKN